MRSRVDGWSRRGILEVPEGYGSHIDLLGSSRCVRTKRCVGGWLSHPDIAHVGSLSVHCFLHGELLWFRLLLRFQASEARC